MSCTNETLSQFSELIYSLAGDCAEHGNCLNGTCICNPGWTGVSRRVQSGRNKLPYPRKVASLGVSSASIATYLGSLFHIQAAETYHVTYSQTQTVTQRNRKRHRLLIQCLALQGRYDCSSSIRSYYCTLPTASWLYSKYYILRSESFCA